MELSDEIEISVPMQTVYDALNNVDILKNAFPDVRSSLENLMSNLRRKLF